MRQFLDFFENRRCLFGKYFHRCFLDFLSFLNFLNVLGFSGHDVAGRDLFESDVKRGFADKIDHGRAVARRLPFPRLNSIIDQLCGPFRRDHAETVLAAYSFNQEVVIGFDKHLSSTPFRIDDRAELFDRPLDPIVHHAIMILIPERQLSLRRFDASRALLVTFSSPLFEPPQQFLEIGRLDEDENSVRASLGNLLRALDVYFENDGLTRAQLFVDERCGCPVKIAVNFSPLEEFTALDPIEELFTRNEEVLAPILLAGSRLASCSRYRYNHIRDQLSKLLDECALAGP